MCCSLCSNLYLCGPGTYLVVSHGFGGTQLFASSSRSVGGYSLLQSVIYFCGAGAVSLRPFVFSVFLRPLAADPTCQLDVFGRDGYSLGMDCTQIRVFEEPHQVGFARLMQGKDRC